MFYKFIISIIKNKTENDLSILHYTCEIFKLKYIKHANEDYLKEIDSSTLQNSLTNSHIPLILADTKNESTTITYKTDSNQAGIFCYINSDNIGLIKQFILSDVITKDPDIINAEIGIFTEETKYTPTEMELDNIIKNRFTRDIFGFDIFWWFIIPPKENREYDPFESDEVLLNSPVYKTEKLPSGAITMQLTENFDLENIDRKYIDTYIKLNKYLARNTNLEIKDLGERIHYKLIGNVLSKKQKIPKARMEINILKTQETNDLNYLITSQRLCEYDTITYNKREVDIEPNKPHVAEEIFKENIRKDNFVLQLKGYGINTMMGLFVYKKREKKNLFYQFVFINEAPILDNIGILEHTGILDSPSLHSGFIKIYFPEIPPTLTELTTIYPNQNTYSQFGFNIHWWFIIPPKGHPERPINPFESDDFLLEAPVYKAQRLKSGATLIQLTEKYDYLNPDNQEYIDTLLKFHEYLKHNMKK